MSTEIDYFQGMSEEDIKDYKEAEKRIQEELIEKDAKNREVLESVKKIVSKKLYKLIEYQIEESEHADDFRIVDAPTGKQQKAEDGIFVWIDQWSVGDSGDSWAGVEYVPLPNGKYLAWGYAIW